MNVTELFIRRPVMTVLLNIALVIAGLAAWGKIPVAALPSYNTPVINVQASLPGASPQTMASSVALPLEKQFSTIAGLTTISSASILGSTSLTLEFDPSRNIDAAAVDVQAALFRSLRALPVEMTSPPSYRKVNPADAPVLLVTLTSPSLNLSDLNDLAENLLTPNLSTIDGVAQVSIYGQKRFAVRIKVSNELLSQRNITLEELQLAIKGANANTPVGVLDGTRQTLTIQANQQLRNAAEFGAVVVGSRNGAPIFLRDVAELQDSFETVKSFSSFNGERSIVLAIQRQPDANTVKVVDAAKAMLPRFRSQLPASVQMGTLNDRSVSIRESLHDVYFTLALTVLLVVLVIFLFLRRAVATLIPTLSLPISLIGALTLLFALGYSLDNISLLGITLAVGLVVDDAIVMLENIVRHIEDGVAPFDAAIRGAREMAFTIVSISISLIAVLIPIFFMPGVIGLLFHEFAVLVGLAILVSAGVSLTLVPMLCARFLRPHGAKPESALGRVFERGFNALLGSYTRSLDVALHHRRWVLGVAVLSFGATAWLYIAIPKGFFPEEDIGQIQASTEGAEDLSFAAMTMLHERVATMVQNDPAVASVAASVGGGGPVNTGRMFINLKPRSERPPMAKVLENLRQQFRAVPGIAVYLRPLQNLQLGGRQSKSRYQYTLQAVAAGELNVWSSRLQEKLRANPLFRDVTSDSQLRGLQANLIIDRERANILGVQMQDLRSALYDAFGERQVASIYAESNTYQVIMEARDAERKSEDAFSKIFLRGRNGVLVPLTAFTTVQRGLGPTSVNHQGQLQAITLSFNLAADVPLGAATAKLDGYVSEIKLPSNIITSYGGDAAVFKDSQGGQLLLIGLAIAVIYVLLGVLYESYIHPLTILAGLPSAAVGALITLQLFGMDLTQYCSLS
jgi:HAE1 family hydrophobic/amphiphilic exporter-1